MKINENFSIDHCVLPAPMCGVMDFPFRKMIAKFGTPLFFSEMVASHAVILKEDEIKKKIRKIENIPTIVQIAGNNPEIMSNAAKMIEALGADAIDINFGCPVKKVVNSYAGSALMKDEPLATKIMETIVNSVKIPVTVKMRMGWDNNSLNAVKLSKIAENVGIKMITIHCRTRCQLYTGVANWSFAKQIKDSINIPVVVNGDIKTCEDVEAALKISNANGVMIGRGLYGKPWLISQICNFIDTGSDNFILKDSLRDIVLEHLDEIFQFYNKIDSVSFAKKHLFFYSKGIQNGADFRNKIGKSETQNELLQLAKDFFKLN